MLIRLISLAALGLLPACSSFSPSQVADPKAISLETASNSAGLAIRYFRMGINGYKPDGSRADNAPEYADLVSADRKSGLTDCEQTITFNISANANDKGDVSLSVPIIFSPVSAASVSNTGKASAEYESYSGANRGNIIQITRTNMACKYLPQILEYIKKGGSIEKLTSAIDQVRTISPASKPVDPELARRILEQLQKQSQPR